MSVEAHECRQRQALVTIFAVKIILDDIALDRSCPFEHGQAAAQWQGCAERELPGRCYDHTPRGAMLRGTFEIKALGIDQYRIGHQAGPL